MLISAQSKSSVANLRVVSGRANRAAPALAAKITAETGRAAKLSEKKPDSEIVEELYLLAYSRKPTGEESSAGAARLARTDTTRRLATEDLLWALINTPEFLFVD